MKDPQRRKWVSSLRRKNWKPKVWDRVCSQHFEESCFLYKRHRRCLTPDAIPTIFAFPSHLKSRIPTLRRSRTSRNAGTGAETSAGTSAETSAGTSAETSAGTSAETSTGTSTETSTGTSAETSTGTSAETSTEMCAATRKPVCSVNKSSKTPPVVPEHNVDLDASTSVSRSGSEQQTSTAPTRETSSYSWGSYTKELTLPSDKEEISKQTSEIST